MRVRRKARAVCFGAAMVGGSVAMTPLSSSAAVDPAPFQATASAMGLQVQTITPGGVVTDELLDSGGPTGQASLNSLGEGAAYAAFPDPGSFIVSAPNLAGIFLAGTPLAALPTVQYPLSIAANSATHPDASAGSAPLTLTARAGSTSATGDARTAIQSTPLGGTATVADSSSVTVKADGTVVATAASVIQGLTIGPVYLGNIASVATETLSPAGQVTPSGKITVEGVRIGNTPLPVSPSTLQGSPVASALAAAGVKLSFETGQEHPQAVISPTLQLTGSLPTTPYTTSPSTYTITLGSAVVTMQASTAGASGTGSLGAPGPEGGSGPATSSPPASTGLTTGSTAAAAGSPVLATGPAVNSAPVVGTGGPAPELTPPSGAPAPSGTSAPTPEAPSSPLAASYVGLFDIRSMYLLVAAIAVAGLLTAQLVRWIGVRRPWTSTPG